MERYDYRTGLLGLSVLCSGCCVALTLNIMSTAFASPDLAPRSGLSEGRMEALRILAETYNGPREVRLRP